MTMVGTSLIGPIADRYFVKRLKRLTYYVYFTLVVVLTITLLTVPSPFRHSKSLIFNIVNNNHNVAFIIIAILASLLGFLTGALVTLFLELAAEISYPVSEGTSNMFNVLVANITAMLIISVGTWINTYWITFLLFVITCICLILLMFAKEQYHRSRL